MRESRMIGFASSGVLALAAHAAPVVTVLHTKIAGHPTSSIPGTRDLNGALVPSEIKAMEDIVLNPRDSGAWLLKARTTLGADLETVMIARRGGVTNALMQEGQFAPGGDPSHRFDFFGSAMGRFNTIGDYVFCFRARTGVTGSTYPADGQRVAVWDGTNIVVRLKQGDLVSGLMDTGATGDEKVGNSVGSAHLLDSGAIGTQDSTTTGISTTRRPVLMYNVAGFKQSNLSTLLDINGVSRTWTTFLANFFYTTVDGAHWAALGRHSGQTSSDDMLAKDGVAVLQSGTAIVASGVIVEDIFNFVLLNNGDWYARGDVTGSNDWFAKNGVLLAKTGDPIVPGSTEHWGPIFYAMHANNNGDYVLAGNTDDPNTGRNSVVVLNGQTVIVREGDRLDLNGNGQLDDDVYIGRTTPDNDSFDADGIQIADDGTVLMMVNIRNNDGQEYNVVPAFGSPSALIKITPGSDCPPCAADYNNDGGITGEDVAAFFDDFENGRPCADVNLDGGITGEDVAAFFVPFEAGSC